MEAKLQENGDETPEQEGETSSEQGGETPKDPQQCFFFQIESRILYDNLSHRDWKTKLPIPENRKTKLPIPMHLTREDETSMTTPQQNSRMARHARE